MKKTTNIIFILLLVNITLGQNLKEKNSLCVINIHGAKVYAKPNFDSKILTELPVGTNIITEKSINSQENLKIGKGFYLSGKWIKPTKIHGFVFSSDLTDKKVKIETNNHGRTVINLLGELKDQKEEKKPIKTENGTFPKYFEYKYYENGTYTYTAFDGCFNHLTEYKNLTLTEVYHQMISDYSAYSSETKKYWIPEPESIQENIIRFFEIGATQNLKIEIRKNGTIVISSYDCT